MVLLFNMMFKIIGNLYILEKITKLIAESLLLTAIVNS
jgi:hypothetical protein